MGTHEYNERSRIYFHFGKVGNIFTTRSPMFPILLLLLLLLVLVLAVLVVALLGNKLGIDVVSVLISMLTGGAGLAN